MHHQVAVIPSLERESPSEPAQRPALLVAIVESKYDHASTVIPCLEEASRKPREWEPATRASGKRDMLALVLTPIHLGFSRRHIVKCDHRDIRIVSQIPGRFVQHANKSLVGLAFAKVFPPVRHQHSQ